AAGELRHIDAVTASLKTDVQLVVAQPTAADAGTDAHGRQEVDGALLQHARAHAIDHVIARTVLQDDRVDPVEVQQVPEQEPGRTGADDSYLGRVNGHNLPTTREKGPG